MKRWNQTVLKNSGSHLYITKTTKDQEQNPVGFYMLYYISLMWCYLPRQLLGWIKAWVKNCCDNWDDFKVIMLSIVIAGLNTLNCVKRSKLTFSCVEPQGHVIDHALKCVKTITWIPTTGRVEKLSFHSLFFWLWLDVTGIPLEWHWT